MSSKTLVKKIRKKEKCPSYQLFPNFNTIHPPPFPSCPQTNLISFPPWSVKFKWAEFYCIPQVIQSMRTFSEILYIVFQIIYLEKKPASIIVFLICIILSKWKLYIKPSMTWVWFQEVQRFKDVFLPLPTGRDSEWIRDVEVFP